MVLEDGVLGRWLGNEGRAIMNKTSDLVKETPKRSLALSAMREHSKKIAVYEPASELSPDTESASAMILDF